jgi:hypothetical protein
MRVGREACDEPSVAGIEQAMAEPDTNVLTGILRM